MTTWDLLVCCLQQKEGWPGCHWHQPVVGSDSLKHAQFKKALNSDFSHQRTNTPREDEAQKGWEEAQFMMSTGFSSFLHKTRFPFMAFYINFWLSIRSILPGYNPMQIGFMTSRGHGHLCARNISDVKSRRNFIHTWLYRCMLVTIFSSFLISSLEYSTMSQIASVQIWALGGTLVYFDIRHRTFLYCKLLQSNNFHQSPRKLAYLPKSLQRTKFVEHFEYKKNTGRKCVEYSGSASHNLTEFSTHVHPRGYPHSMLSWLHEELLSLNYLLTLTP